MKRWLCAALAVLLVMLSGCRYELKNGTGKQVYSFTDSSGRVVELSVDVKTVAPTGPLSQIMLMTLCPDKLVGLSESLSKRQRLYFDDKFQDMPVLGKLYGKGSTMNYEELVAQDPDVIIDIGDAKEGITDDLNALQEQTGIPVIFVQASIATTAQAYRTLGGVVGESARGEALADYADETLEQAEAYRAQIPDSERKTVLYSLGEYGTEVGGPGTSHSEVIEYAGGVNAAQITDLNASGLAEVSFEQIYLWDQEVVVMSFDSCFDDVYTDGNWAETRAVKNHSVYEIPAGPYSFIDRPPSIQRILAVKWLGNLLYPDVFDYDMAAETVSFYKLFYNYDMGTSEAKLLLNMNE